MTVLRFCVSLLRIYVNESETMNQKRHFLFKKADMRIVLGLSNSILDSRNIAYSTIFTMWISRLIAL